MIENFMKNEGVAFFNCNKNELDRNKSPSILQSYMHISTIVNTPEVVRASLQNIRRRLAIMRQELAITYARSKSRSL
ncbi:hypothetical protein BDV33DRAFT_177681 [Aspergillus novoparasiticus]|uniref:Uncharacterized protein n=1 Tax=Aspergillus novoparasiticus TaxID=986946 RepID=A0A5N6EJ39_9EURO|nr:hypothetical protein BDV33DRAFT_177681 [Aspergillus novoparasiticus]